MGSMERTEERRPIAGNGIGMQFALLMDDLMRGAQIFQELVAQLYGNFGKGAFAACKQVEVQECLLIARVFFPAYFLK